MPTSPVQMQSNATKSATSSPAHSLHPDALIRLTQILGTNGQAPLLACGRTQFYLWIKQGKLPAPHKVGHCSFWRAGDILTAIGRLS